MERHEHQGLKEFKDQVGRALDLFYEKVGKEHHAVSGQVAQDYDPPADVGAHETEFTITLELPGLDIKDLEIEASDVWLSVRGEKSADREHSERTYHLRERHYGSFERGFALPADVDSGKAKADFENGVLTIRMPRKAGKKKPAAKRIPVKSK